mgnify:FL=1
MTSTGDADRPTRPPNARRKSTDDRVRRGLHGASRTKSQTQLDTLSRKAPQKNTGKAITRTEQVDNQSENNWTSASPSSSPEAPGNAPSSKESSPRVERLDARAANTQATAESNPVSPTTAAPETGTGAPSPKPASHDSVPDRNVQKRAQTFPDPQAQASNASPTEMRPSQSMRSIRSRRSMLLGRDAFQPTAPVAPVLDTRRVTSTQHGIETDERPSQAPARFYLGEQEDARVPASRPSMHSLGSSSNLTLEEMGQEHAHAPQFARSRADSVSSLTSLMERTPGMRRTTSTQSLNETHLQRSMSSHEHLTQLLQRNLGMRRGSAMPSVSSENSGPVRVGAGGTGSKLMATTFANLLHGRPVERQTKPIVSKFARYQQQFDPSASAQSVLAQSHADNVPGRVISVEVPPTSVFSEGFVDRVKAQLSHEEVRSRRNTNDSVKAPQQYRYLLDYGLSGPSIDKDSLSHVELTPRVDSGLPLDSPTLQETPMRVRGNLRAASTPRMEQSVTERAKLVVPDSATTLGPNMIPFHFIHALTSTFENALALDRAEVPAMASLLPGVADRDDPVFAASPPDEDTVTDSAGEAEEHVHFIDNQSMRAIAYTAQAVSIQRIHTVTRRFSDPFREALVRVANGSGYMAYLHTQEHAGQAGTAKRAGPQGTQDARGGSGLLWHRGSHRDRPHAAGARQSSPSLTRSNTALAALGTLAGRAESPRHAGVRGRVN